MHYIAMHCGLSNSKENKSPYFRVKLKIIKFEM